MKNLPIIKPEPASSDGGFSIIEALIVMMIGSTILAVLTPMLLSSQRVNAKVSDVFDDRSDRIFFEIQMSEILKSFVDPDLWAPKSPDGPAISFVGTPVSFTGVAHAPLGLTDGETEVRIEWIGQNTDGIGTNQNSNGNGVLLTTIGEKQIAWPQSWPDSMRFSYLDSEGKSSPNWPTASENNSPFSLTDERSPESLPTAIMIEDASRPKVSTEFFVYSLKL